MKTKFFENLQFVVLIGLIVAQCVVGNNFYLGQFIYLGCNTISVARNFALDRPLADKVKDCACFGITLGLILFNYFLKKQLTTIKNYVIINLSTREKKERYFYGKRSIYSQNKR